MESKTLTKLYEETDHPTIAQAYDELSREAFSVWMRLMVMSNNELQIGKKNLSKVCNYSLNRFYSIMKELYNKGYVAYVKHKRLGTKHIILLKKRALISGRNSFVILSSTSNKTRVIKKR
jgi:predicted transcriptional regulator